jgi:methionyl aminopeptidase
VVVRQAALFLWLNLDVTIYVDGVHGDSNATFCVGEVDATSCRLVRVTRERLGLRVVAACPGTEVRPIGLWDEATFRPSRALR